MKTLLCILLLSNICYSQNTIIWEVIDTINNRNSFIVGTFHNIGNAFVDSIPMIKTALLNADVAIFESIDDENKLADLLQKRKIHNELEQLMPEQDYTVLKELCKDWKIELSALKPIEVLLTLRRKFTIEKCGTVKPTDDWDHFDNYLIDIVKKNKIAMLGLETDSMQLKLLDDFEKSADKSLISLEISFWISKLTNQQEYYEECQEIRHYQRFEIDYEFENDCVDDIMVIKRNEEWIKTLKYLFSQKNCFVAVGLLHLKYNCGLLENFKRMGFIVRPVEIKKAGH